MKKNRILSFLLAAVMVLTGLPLTTMASSPVTAADESQNLLEDVVWMADGAILTESTPANFEAIAGEGATSFPYVHVDGLKSTGAVYSATNGILYASKATHFLSTHDATPTLISIPFIRISQLR